MQLINAIITFSTKILRMLLIFQNCNNLNQLIYFSSLTFKSTKMRFQLFLLLAFAVVSCQQKNNAVLINSPSGNLAVEININEQGEIYYQVISKEDVSKTLVIESSPLGLMRNDANFENNLSLQNKPEINELTDSYTMLSGKFSKLSYIANESELNFRNEDGKDLNVVFRVFDEGVAFRYEFPGESTELYSVKSEKTGFNVGTNADAWMSPYQTAKPWGDPGYEADYLNVNAGTLSPEEVGWSFPLLFKTEQNWIYISEAGLDRNYCGTHLNQDCDDGVYKIRFPEENERLGDGKVEPSSELPWKMPWRFILVSDKLNTIVESSMVYHLAEPNTIENTSWIKPGRASWEWWSSKSGRTVKQLNKFIDLAAQMGWEYSLVDAGWENMPDGNIEDVIDYAKQKNVDLLFWYNSGGRRDSTASNEDFVMFGDETREKEMAKLQKWGVKGIKVDFFATDKQIAIEQYINILEDAAKYNLLVNFHGCTLPRGWTRTYPNLLTMEAVRGAECYRFSEPYPEIAAEYNTIATIVRGTAGPTDYTPATFSNNRYPHITTFGHELALTLVYESGIIHMADTPESYLSLPEKAIDFLKQVPAAWDETKLIKAAPGEVFVVARRKGENWYLAGINGKNETGEVQFELPQELTSATLISDGNEITDLKIEEMTDIKEISITMKPNGGFVLF